MVEIIVPSGGSQIPPQLRLGTPHIRLSGVEFGQIGMGFAGVLPRSNCTARNRNTLDFRLQFRFADIRRS